MSLCMTHIMDVLLTLFPLSLSLSLSVSLSLFFHSLDPYVKLYLFHNNQRIAKKKTHVKKHTTNPVFNESFVFDVPFSEGLQNLSLVFFLLGYDKLYKNKVIGKLEIGSKSEAAKHWHEVEASPRRQIAEWHKLKE